MRLPVEALQPQLGPILEGVLLWAADSKNKFKLKVRRLAASSRLLWMAACWLAAFSGHPHARKGCKLNASMSCHADHRCWPARGEHIQLSTLLI
jgi:hypothetical protein